MITRNRSLSSIIIVVEGSEHLSILKVTYMPPNENMYLLEALKSLSGSFCKISKESYKYLYYIGYESFYHVKVNFSKTGMGRLGSMVAASKFFGAYYSNLSNFKGLSNTPLCFTLTPGKLQ